MVVEAQGFLNTNIDAQSFFDQAEKKIAEELLKQASGSVVLYVPSGADGRLEMRFSGPQRKLETRQKMDRYKCSMSNSHAGGDCQPASQSASRAAAVLFDIQLSLRFPIDPADDMGRSL